MRRDPRSSQSLQKDVAAGLHYLWHLTIPLSRFRDASHGTIEQRIANYRYNRSRRRMLPVYVWTWMGIALCMWQLTRLLAAWMQATPAESSLHFCLAVACMGTGIVFAFSCAVITVLFASYLYLSGVKK